MRTFNKEIIDGVLSVTLQILPEEFEKALQDAYVENTERFVVPGYAPGLAPRNKIEEFYGVSALYDEALDLCIPKIYNTFLEENNISIIGRPCLTEVNWMTEGGVSFTITCDLYPTVKLGTYKGITVTEKREDDEEVFSAAVLTKACMNMETTVPNGMIEQKLNAIIAQEKIRINQDAIYHVLADSIEILEKAYHKLGVNRPKLQVRAEALDIMLQTVSKDNKQVTKEFFAELVKELLERYRSIPKDIDTILDTIIDERSKKKGTMTADQKAAEAFDAYLGSLELNEKQWREQRHLQAADAALFDLLLNEVAKKENLSVSASEIQAAFYEISNQCDVEIDEVTANIDQQLVYEQLLRDKARHFILDNAITL